MGCNIAGGALKFVSIDDPREVRFLSLPSWVTVDILLVAEVKTVNRSQGPTNIVNEAGSPAFHHLINLQEEAVSGVASVHRLMVEDEHLRLP
jgi:hypothetical protein